MSTAEDGWDVTDLARYELASDWWLTMYGAMTLALLRNHGQDEVADLEGLLFARYQSTHFLPALDKLGLGDEPTDAIRCAKYHYFGNSLGGIEMEYVEETPDKVWIRYMPPCFSYDHKTRPSSGIAALGNGYGEAPMRNWHANNGKLLGNPRLGFVMTQVQADGDPWDGGYFLEYDHDLTPEETFRRTRGDWGPKFDPAKAPALPHEAWPAERRAGAMRNYAINYAALKMSLLVERLGVDAAAAVVRHAFSVVFYQRFAWLPQVLAVPDPATPAGAARLIARLGATTDDDITVEEAGGGRVLVHLGGTRLHKLFPDMPPLLEEVIAGSWMAAFRLYNRDLRVSVVKPLAGSAGPGRWELVTES